jgi:predicted nucleotidyltransferase
MPELTDNQIADLRVLQKHCGALGAEFVIIGAIAYQIHFPEESRHTGDIDFAVALDLDEFAELERRLLADGWVRFANREHRWRSAQGTILDLIPAGPKLREPKQITWPISQFTMSLVGFDHVFATAQPVQLAPDLTLKVISSTALMLLKIVAFMDDPQRRVKDLDDIRGLLLQYEADSERIFSDVVIRTRRKRCPLPYPGRCTARNRVPATQNQRGVPPGWADYDQCSLGALHRAGTLGATFYTEVIPEHLQPVDKTPLGRIPAG